MPSDEWVKTSIESLVARVVVHRLVAAHIRPSRKAPSHPAVFAIVNLLIKADANAALDALDELCEDSTSFAAFSASILEPTARTLGDLWETDRCSQAELTLGLSRLQIALLRASANIRTLDNAVRLRDYRVLSASPPDEPHALGSAIAAEVMRRAGWHVGRAAPATDAELSRTLQQDWFDVLDLSASPAVAREHRIPAMARSVRAARSSSRNPRLVVIIDGRLIHDRPGAVADIGADAGSDSALCLANIIVNQMSVRRDLGLASA